MESKITYEQVLQLIEQTTVQIRTSSAETDKKIKELAEQSDKRFRELTEQSAETDKKIKELTEEMKASSAETDKKLKELAEEMKASSAETDKKIKESAEQIKKLAKQVGNITDSLGSFAEEQVLPKILELFKERNVILQAIFRNTSLKKPDGDFFLQIDAVLVNTQYSVILEVKHSLKQKDVDDHIERLNKIQANPELIKHLLKGTIMYGAIATLNTNLQVEDYAIKNGLYVLKPNGENIEIANKNNFDAKSWVA